jgi:hypothetical protein
MARTSLKYRILYLLFVALIIGAAALYSHQSYNAVKQRTILRLTHDSQMVEEWIKGAFIASKYVLRDIIDHIPLEDVKYPPDNPEKHKRQKAFLEKKRLSLPHAILVGLMDKDCIVTHTNSIDGFDASQREFCRVMRKKPHPGSMVSHAFRANNGSLNVTQTLKYRQGQPGYQGMAALAMDMAIFSKWLNKLGYSKTSLISIFDTNQVLLARIPPLPDKIGISFGVPQMKKFIKSTDEFAVVEAISPVDGLMKINAIRKVKGLPFIVFIGQANKAWQAGLVMQFWLTGLAVLLILGASYLALQKQLSLRQKNMELQNALSELDTLSGLLPICASCKKIRDDQGYWNRIESYVSKRTGAKFSHSLCPECAEKLYGNEKWYQDSIDQAFQKKP